MAFLDQEGHRVELTCRGYALLSGEEAAPRLDIGFIESVRLGAHLKDDGVDAACLQVIKLADEVIFSSGRESYPCIRLEKRSVSMLP